MGAQSSDVACMGPSVHRQPTSASSHETAKSGWTMQSDKRHELEVVDCGEAEAVQHALAALSTRGPSPCRSAVRPTVEHAVRLVLQARSGVCIMVAPDEELRRLVKHAHCSDEGAMTQCMKGLHVTDPEFHRRFFEFTEHSETDRWPDNHPEEALRGKPKDGVAALLSTSGFRVKSAVRLEGLPLASKNWSKKGMRHMTALAAADFLLQAMVVVRSCAGEVHVLVKQHTRELTAYRVAAGYQAQEGVVMKARRRLSRSASQITAQLHSVSGRLPSVSSTSFQKMMRRNTADFKSDERSPTESSAASPTSPMLSLAKQVHWPSRSSESLPDCKPACARS